MMLAFTGFMFGAIGLTVPVILHLIRRKPTEITKFPAFMFLRESVVAKHARNNFRKWIILLLRCLAFLLLSAAFAWPYLPNFAKIPKSATVLLWDNSFSMTSKSYFNEMKSSALKKISETDRSNPMLIGIIAGKTSWSPKFTGDSASLAEFLKKHLPGESGSRFDAALREADARLEEMPGKKKKIILFTDRQKLPWRDVVFTHPLSPGVGFEVLTPKKTGFDNIAITSMKPLSPFINAGEKIIFSIDVQNFSKKQFDAELKISANAKVVFHENIFLNPMEKKSLMFGFAPRKLAPFGLNAELVADDDISCDNFRFVSLNPEKLPEVAINGKSDGFDFVRLAYQTSGENKVAELVPFSEKNIENADFIIVREIPNTAERKRIEKIVENGGDALILWRDSPRMRNFLLHFGIKASVLPYQHLVRFETIDFDHPLFKRFRNVKIGGFFEIAFFSTPKLVMPANSTIIAEYSNGFPAIAVLRHKKGRLFIIASSLDRKSSNWTVHSSFLPFMRELLRFSTAAGKESSTFALGQIVDTSRRTRITDVKTGNSFSPAKPFSPARAGNYMLKNKSDRKMISVNVPIEESKNRLLPENFKTSQLISMRHSVMEKADMDSFSPEQGRTFWWIILLFAALVILSELLLANRTAL
ncbi:MAG: VWA domain-containing protein [Kiritimatiellaeota bacterium]|nr:VWA domain-containing protein [Kiritimatiellota bacterium]